jgi:hypothetical protein
MFACKEKVSLENVLHLTNKKVIVSLHKGTRDSSTIES